jgi:plastocyanin domain-containing protein
MDTAQIIVTLGGFVLALFVIWYFFFSEREYSQAVISKSGVQEISITVKGGYSPDIIEVAKDKPVRLKFFRDEDNSCSEEIIFGDFGIRRDLPAFQTTVIELIPKTAGEFEFVCGMNMLRGRLIVK